MPSRSRKRYFEKKKIEQRSQEQDTRVPDVKKTKRGMRPRTLGILLFVLSLLSSITFTVLDLFIPGMIVTSVIVFFSIQQFRKDGLI